YYCTTFLLYYYAMD
nr:immunoglobulin heavy chain junction region [Mus musculus]